MKVMNTYIKKGNGPRTDPCGTPYDMLRCVGMTEFTVAACC